MSTECHCACEGLGKINGRWIHADDLRKKPKTRNWLIECISAMGAIKKKFGKGSTKKTINDNPQSIKMALNDGSYRRIDEMATTDVYFKMLCSKGKGNNVFG